MCDPSHRPRMLNIPLLPVGSSGSAVQRLAIRLHFSSHVLLMTRKQLDRKRRRREYAVSFRFNPPASAPLPPRTSCSCPVWVFQTRMEIILGLNVRMLKAESVHSRRLGPSIFLTHSDTNACLRPPRTSGAVIRASISQQRVNTIHLLADVCRRCVRTRLCVRLKAERQKQRPAHPD